MLTRKQVLFFLILWLSSFKSLSFNAVDLVKDSISPECIDYCLEGVCVYLVCSLTPPNCSVHLTPRISYKQPDAIVMVYGKQGEAPWDEWRASIGRVMSEVEKPLVRALTGTKPNGGKTTLPNQGGTAHTLYFKNADVIGHPAAYLFNELSRGRGRGTQIDLPRPQLELDQQGNVAYPDPQPRNEVDTSDQPHFNNRNQRNTQLSGNNLANRTENAIPSNRELSQSLGQLPMNIRDSVADNISGQINNAREFPGKIREIFSNENSGVDSPSESLLKNFGNFDSLNDPRFAEIMDVDAIKEAMAIQKEFGEFQEKSQELGEAASAFGGSTGGNLFCPSEVGPLNPYFISVLDSIGWRLGFPDRFSINTWLPHSQVVGDFPTNKWGKIFPRQGLIYGIDEPKSAAVIAERAMHLVTRPNQNHVYAQLKGPQHNAGEGTWQMLHPDSGKSCKTFGETRKFPFSHSKDGSYAFNYWRPYSCCLDPKGIYLRTVTVPKLCF